MCMRVCVCLSIHAHGDVCHYIVFIIHFIHNQYVGTQYDINI